MTVIDLGELRHDDQPAPEPRRPRAVGRPLRVAVAGLLALLSLVAAAPPPDRPVRLVSRTLPEPAFLVAGELLVLVESTGGGSLPARRLHALALADGRERWTWALPGGAQLAGFDTVADGVVVSLDTGRGQESVLLDRGDGRVRWRQPGVAVPTGDGGLLLNTNTTGEVILRRVHPVSGAVRWTAAMPFGMVMYRMAGPRIAAIVVVDDGGRVEIRDPATGVRRFAFRVPAARDETYEVSQVVGDLLLVDGEPGQLDAYELDTGKRRWQLPYDRPAPFAYECDSAVCVGRPNGGMRVLDPATGRPRWAGEQWAPAFRVGDRLLAARAGESDQLALLDPATGRVTADLGRWRLLGGPWLPRPLLLTRPLAGDRHLVGELDAEGAIRLRDVVPEAGDLCSAQRGAMVCWGHTGELRLWRLTR
ncbi:PQQ-binding-like beta-propeller repeat protein [Micromonospora sp. CPCC 205711]|uniref:outer membrane protein assembly factor BamB family protein n=1 Tax=Micromonospora sp. CPCC 205547 TaxID=3122400 RepID=UPI002FF1824E